MKSVRLRVPAEKTFVGLVSSTATAVAAHANLSIDGLKDLHLGIDEAFGIVIAHEPDAGDVEVTFDITEQAVTVSISGPAGGSVPSSDTWSWMILCGVTDNAEATASADGAVTVTMQTRVVTSA